MGRRSSLAAALVLVALVLIVAAPVHAAAAEEGVVVYGVDHSGDASSFTVAVYVNGSFACSALFGAKRLDVYRFTSHSISGRSECAAVEYVYRGEKLYALLVRATNISVTVAKDVQWHQTLVAALTLGLVQPFDF
jgi:hypothetical protein